MNVYLSNQIWAMGSKLNLNQNNLPNEVCWLMPTVKRAPPQTKNVRSHTHWTVNTYKRTYTKSTVYCQVFSALLIWTKKKNRIGELKWNRERKKTDTYTHNQKHKSQIVIAKARSERRVWRIKKSFLREYDFRFRHRRLHCCCVTFFHF